MKDMSTQKSLVLYGDLVIGFQNLGIHLGDTLIVHASLSQLGFVVGGAETVIRALLHVLGSEGTLIMPSQTWKNLDPSTGVHWLEPEEWWPFLREHWPAYDKKVTPAIGMGIVAELFAKWPGVERSDHPARSFAAFGKQAKHITEHHDLSNIFGKGSPLDKIYQLNGKILLLGVGYNKNTSLHLAETIASFNSKKFDNESSALLIEGTRHWVTYMTQAVDDVDFIPLGEAFEATNTVSQCRIGDAIVRLIDQPTLVDFSVSWFEKNRV